ncbi:MAG: 16S rRNA (uracil(1498)-N(3))-methyltransferase [Wenzhouxiangella sp.]|nr:MAG: 16S rRNA (uracil(1498)-N(3))-methyltransferase [Wenzhouxiangella sp.]
MRVVRVHIDRDLAGQASIDLTGAPAHYLLRVLRLRAGASVALFDGSGLEYPGEIVATEARAGCRVRLDAPRAPAVESAFQVTLIQAVGRGDRMDWCVQKTTELGVARIQPVFTERTEVRLDERRALKRRDHWHQVAVSAAEQSGRVRVPQIDQPVALEDLPTPSLPGFYLDPGATLTPGELTMPAPPRCTVIIGPEGGLTEAESARLVRSGCQGLRLGPRILRTETAGPAVLAILQSRFGDLA